MGLDNKTLGEHAREFWMERGIDTSKLDPDQKQKSYELWATWAFCNMSDKNGTEQAQRMRDIERWEANLK